MKFKSSTVLMLLLSGIFLACNSDSTTSTKLAPVQDELLESSAIIDSLRQKVTALEEENLQLLKKKGKEKPAILSRDEAAVQKMVVELKRAFNKISDDKDHNKILRFFLPTFSTNQVTINLENEAEIALLSPEDFKAYLKKLARTKGVSLVMGKIVFLDTQIKGELFTTTFKNSAKVYKNNQLISNRTIVSTITGRNQDGWKIGNYSWVSIDYPLR